MRAHEHVRLCLHACICVCVCAHAMCMLLTLVSQVHIQASVTILVSEISQEHRQLCSASKMELGKALCMVGV